MMLKRALACFLLPLPVIGSIRGRGEESNDIHHERKLGMGMGFSGTGQGSSGWGGGMTIPGAGMRSGMMGMGMMGMMMGMGMMGGSQSSSSSSSKGMTGGSKKSGDFSEVYYRLLPYVPGTAEELSDPETYQFCALMRTEEQINILGMTDEKIVQYYALYTIYCATNGVENEITIAHPDFAGLVEAEYPRWTFVDGWEETNLDPCDGWYGISCDANGLIFGISLEGNGLTGSFPPEVALLASDGVASTGAGNLNRLEVHDNEFLTNNNDASWVPMLGSNLEFLDYGSTSFGGEVPILPENIIQYDNSFSLISGPLTDEPFQGLESLEYVALDGNPYNSSVPSVFGSLPSLEALYISQASIVGNLSYMEGMYEIVEHWIDGNPDLGGTIPDFIGELITLQSLSVTDCGLVGTIPDTVGNLLNMDQCWFYGNSLTGHIPSTFGNIPLFILQLEDNDLSGDMPDDICDNVFPSGDLFILGADCGEVNCTCCTCCSRQECS